MGPDLEGGELQILQGSPELCRISHMKISRRRFSQLLSGLLLSPLVKNAEASPEPQPEPQPEAPIAQFPPFTQLEGGPHGLYQIQPDTTAANDLFVGMPRDIIDAFKPLKSLSDEEIENMARWIDGS